MKWRRIRTRRVRRIAVIAGLVSVTVMVAAGYAPLQREIERRERIAAAAELRGIAQGIALYMGNNGGQWPPTDRWQEMLVAGGYATTEMFAPRRGVGGYDRYMLVSGGESSAPMIVENPAAWGGEGGNIAYNDNHVEWMSAEGFAPLFVRGDARGPVEFPPARSGR